MMHRVITANRLQDGAVIWLAADGNWVEEVDRAMACDEGEAASALASAKALEAAGHVIGAYEVEVELDARPPARRLLPVRLRERIRADGPTVAFG